MDSAHLINVMIGRENVDLNLMLSACIYPFWNQFKQWLLYIYTFIVCSQIYGSTHVPIIMYIVKSIFIFWNYCIRTVNQQVKLSLFSWTIYTVLISMGHIFQTFVKEISAIWHVHANKCSWTMAFGMFALKTFHQNW